MKKTLLILIAIVFTAALVFIDSIEAAPKYGGTLRISRFTYEGVNLGDPLRHRGMTSYYQAGPALETLLRHDKNAAPIPWLATSWKEDPKAKTITFILRKGVKFHDGTDFNARAVQWNLQHLIDGKSQAARRFASVDVIDNYTVRINLKEWDSTTITSLTSDPGQMISPTTYQKNGPEWAADHPVGTGPFKFVEWKKNNYVLYERNPNYWQKGKPYLDQIKWITISDMNVKAMSFQAGELDSVLTMDKPQIIMLTKAGYPALRQFIGSGCDGYVFSSGSPDSAWSNLKVRQAAMHAINTKEYTEAIFGNEAEPANQLVGKISWAYNPNIVGYPYNPEKAKQLLKEAGYPNGLKSKIYGSQDPTMNNRALAIQDYLRKVGIECEIEIISDAQSREMTSQGKGWEGLIIASLGRTPDVLITFARMYAGGGMMFKSMLTPDDYLQKIKDAIMAPDFKTKQKLVQDIMKMYVDKYCLMLTLDTRYDNGFEQKYVRDSGILRSANTQMWTPEDCWLDK
jgi:ABC-type transport system substrate-binding protein